jgi:hypothetical protein
MDKKLAWGLIAIGASIILKYVSEYVPEAMNSIDLIRGILIGFGLALIIRVAIKKRKKNSIDDKTIS